MEIKASDTTFTRKAEAKNKKAKQQGKQKKDILHDSPVRYIGYCDDIGATARVLCNKSTNAFVRSIPVISYIPVAAYIGADVLSAYNKSKHTEGKEIAKKRAISQGIFQGITSILFPIGIVTAAQKAAGKAFDKFIPALKGQLENGAKNHKRDVALALAGLGALIAVSKYADKFAKNVLMNKIINPIIGIKENKTERKGETGIKDNAGTTQA